MLDMTLEDATNKFLKTVMMIDGCAKYIKEVRHLDEFSVLDIRSGMTELCLVNEKNLKAPTRIGFIQYEHQVVYASRIATRQWKAGLTTENVSFVFPECPRGGLSKASALSVVRRLTHSTMADSIENVYPTLKIARRKAKQANGTYAFDRQFAVDCNDKVYYKTHQVGDVVKGTIVFHDSAVSLQCLLGEQNA